jgi:antitoxin CptB
MSNSGTRDSGLGTREEPGTNRVPNPESREVSVNRLRWRTRRGTRELDALFGGWLESSFPTADEALRQAFDELLDVQDPDLWDWVMGHAKPPRADWQEIIDDIRARHRL